MCDERLQMDDSDAHRMEMVVLVAVNIHGLELWAVSAIFIVICLATRCKSNDVDMNKESAEVMMVMIV